MLNYCTNLTPEMFSDADEIDEDFEPADYHGEFADYEDPNEDDDE